MEYGKKKLKNEENETHTQWRNRNMARNLKNVENDTQTLFNLEYGQKHS